MNMDTQRAFEQTVVVDYTEVDGVDYTTSRLLTLIETNLEEVMLRHSLRTISDQCHIQHRFTVDIVKVLYPKSFKGSGGRDPRSWLRVGTVNRSVGPDWSCIGNASNRQISAHLREFRKELESVFGASCVETFLRRKVL
jgi:hypothetical protein